MTDDSAATERLKALFWLGDAPLFIDEPLVARFFDAIVRPKYERLAITEESEEETEDKILATIGVSATGGLKLPEWLKPIKFEASGKAEASGETREHIRSRTVSQLKPIWNAERQLEELARHYLARHPERLIGGTGPLVEGVVKGPWYDAPAEYFTEVPRVLAFLDLPSGTQLIPTAAEFADGKVVLLYNDLVKALKTDTGGPAEVYPDNREDTPEQLRVKRKEYWATFQQFFSSRKAMIVVEEASEKHGRINWIDFRLAMDNNGSTLHLHLAPNGQFDAGVFGYNFVRRAEKHGVRVVGTLKSEPDMNVLALYDK